MGKFDPTIEDIKVIKASLLTGITLLVADNKFVWAEYEEIPGYLKEGYSIFSDTKRMLYDKIPH